MFYMPNKRLLVISRKEIFHKFETLSLSDIEVVVADEADLNAYEDTLSDFDLVFLRTKNETVLKTLSGKTDVRILDQPDAVEFCLDRFLILDRAASAGVPIPEQFLPGNIPNGPVVGKNRIDRGDNIPRLMSPEEWCVGDYPYAQQYLKSDWEYKVYMFGALFWFYRQRPTLDFPDKLSTREPIEKDQLLKKFTQCAAYVAGLKMVSADFLEVAGQFYLTDLNPTPGLQNLPGGYQAIMPELRKMLD